MAKKHKLTKQQKMLEKNAENFAEELEALAEKIGIKFEGHKERHDDWGFRVFGFVAPLLGSVFGALFLLFFAWMINLINTGLGISLFSSIYLFVRNNIYLFFGLFIFFGYSDYFSKRYKKTFWTVSPIINGVGLLFAIWISIFVLNVISNYYNSVFLCNVSNILYSNMLGLYFVFILLGYILILIEKSIIIKGLK